MTPVAIKNKIKAILAADSDLIAYPIKNIFEGIRDNVSQDDYPFIVIEPSDNAEGTRRDVNGTIDNTIIFAITAAIHQYNLDDQLDLIFDLENKIKIALSQDVDLNGEAVNSRFDRSVYNVEFWPIRAVTIPFVVEYRQQFKTRV